MDSTEAHSTSELRRASAASFTDESSITRTLIQVSTPRAVRHLCKQRGKILKAVANGEISREAAVEALSKLRTRVRDDAWAIRADVELPVLVLTKPDGTTEVMAESKGFVAKWWPVLPLLVLSVLALWGFATSTADEGREDVIVTVPVTTPAQP